MRLSRLVAGVVLPLIGLAVFFGGERAAAQAANQQYAATSLQAGYKLYAAQCALCHANNGHAGAGGRLARQQLRRASTDADIKNPIAIGVPAAGMPSFPFEPDELDALVAYIRSGFDLTGAPFRVGDAARGKAIYDGKGGCAACHRVLGNGSRVAP